MKELFQKDFPNESTEQIWQRIAEFKNPQLVTTQMAQAGQTERERMGNEAELEKVRVQASYEEEQARRDFERDQQLEKLKSSLKINVEGGKSNLPVNEYRKKIEGAKAEIATLNGQLSSRMSANKDLLQRRAAGERLNKDELDTLSKFDTFKMELDGKVKGYREAIKVYEGYMEDYAPVQPMQIPGGVPALSGSISGNRSTGRPAARKAAPAKPAAKPASAPKAAQKPPVKKPTTINDLFSKLAENSKTAKYAKK
jgi:hypothetical protein